MATQEEAPDIGRMATGMKVGDEIRIGNSKLKFASRQGVRITIVIEADRSIPILREAEYQKLRNEGVSE